MVHLKNSLISNSLIQGPVKSLKKIPQSNFFDYWIQFRTRSTLNGLTFIIIITMLKILYDAKYKIPNLKLGNKFTFTEARWPSQDQDVLSWDKEC